MKTDEKVKEKAILKLKEIRSKPDEMGLKAKQYIEGLLKIPFSIYREEPSLKQIKIINTWIIRIISVIKSYELGSCWPIARFELLIPDAVRASSMETGARHQFLANGPIN